MKNRLHSGRCAAALLALFAVASAADAQRRLTFNPYLFLEQTYTTNARFRPVDEEADWFTRAAVVFPLTYDMDRKGSFFASYKFFVDRFQTLDDLDSEGQQLDLSYSVKPSERSNFRIGASWVERSDQGGIRSNIVDDIFLTPRLENRVFRIGAVYSRWLSQTWRFRTGLTYADYDFDRATADQNDVIFTQVQGRDGWIWDVNLGKRLSERTTTGFGYSYSDFTLDPIRGDSQFSQEGDEQIQNLYWFLRYTVGPLWRYELRLGYFDRRGTGSDGNSLERDGWNARVLANRTFRRSSLEVFAAYAPTSEGLQRGTSTVTSVGVALRDATPGRWDWELFARASNRDPALAPQADIDIVTGGGFLQWNLQRLLTLRLTSVYTEQTSDDFFSNRQVWRTSLGLYWFPLGRTTIGGAPPVPFSDFEE